MKDLTFAEMFSGVGGFRLGLERSGWQCVWANDSDKYANQVYKKKFGNEELVEGDVREIRAKAIPDHQLLTAGFPCQAFSVAGKRKATAEARGTLFTHIARVAARKRPQLLLLENVKGLLSSESGRTFAVILRTLGNLGYLLEWQVLNSKFFGVPQNRERVFLVGHLGGKGSRQIFPLKQDGGAATLPSGKPLQISGAITRRYHKQGNADTYVVGVTLANTSRYKQGVNRTPLKQDDSSFALGSSGDQGVMQNMRIRRLTPTECERLQGFPDGWTKGVSDTQRYKLLGNAVTVNVIQFLGYKLEECLN